jgi:hypothetical protein
MRKRLHELDVREHSPLFSNEWQGDFNERSLSC